MLRPSGIVILVACLCPVAAPASDHPLTKDIHRELIRFLAKPGHKHSVGFRHAAIGTHGTLQALLVDPASPYSELIDQPRMTNTLWWHTFSIDVAAREPEASTADIDTDVLHTLQWQLGLTKSRPDIDVAISRNDTIFRLFGSLDIAAQLRKADIDADILLKARDLYPTSLTRAATEAVAVQIIRDQMQSIDESRYEAFGVKPSVVMHYLSTADAALIDESDARYLHEALSSALESRHMPIGKDGEQRLPAAWRVARVAAALRDMQGYAGTPPCDHSEVRAGYADVHPDDIYEKPLCFVDATDRGVHAWYLAEARRERLGIPYYEKSRKGFSAFLMWVGALMPLLDAVAILEAVEAAVADELLEEGAISAEEAEEAAVRERNLVCDLDAR